MPPTRSSLTKVPLHSEFALCTTARRRVVVESYIESNFPLPESVPIVVVPVHVRTTKDEALLFSTATSVDGILLTSLGSMEYPVPDVNSILPLPVMLLKL